MGLGLAYKSFALVAPAAAALWCAQLLSAPKLNWQLALQTSLKVGLSAALALGVFGLWFVLDPDPGAVWQEFVIGENAGKLSSSVGYWQVALHGGGGSLWAQLLAYVQNAGLLAGVAVGLIWFGLKQGLKPDRGTPPHAAALWILLAWLTVWLVVFTLPSQRSARYVIPAMPALAILIALYWQQIARGWFWISLLLCGFLMVAMGRIAWAAHDLGIGSDTDLWRTLIGVAASLALVSAGLLRPAWTRTCTVAACLCVYLCFGLTTAPLNGPAGHYDKQVTSQLKNKRIAVPSQFNAQFERFEFLLPGNQFVPYDGEGYATAGLTAEAEARQRLLSSHDALVWLPSDAAQVAPRCAPECTVLGSRWEVKGRHRSGEITLSTLWTPQNWLFRREWLLTNAASPAADPRP